MIGQTYEPGDHQPVTPLDDRIAGLAAKLCAEHRRVLDVHCHDPAKRTVLLALERLLAERNGGA